jgi:hypothetical protein
MEMTAMDDHDLKFFDREYNRDGTGITALEVQFLYGGPDAAEATGLMRLKEAIPPTDLDRRRAARRFAEELLKAVG